MAGNLLPGHTSEMPKYLTLLFAEILDPWPCKSKAITEIATTADKPTRPQQIKDSRQALQGRTLLRHALPTEADRSSWCCISLCRGESPSRAGRKAPGRYPLLLGVGGAAVPVFDLDDESDRACCCTRCSGAGMTLGTAEPPRESG